MTAYNRSYAGNPPYQIRGLQKMISTKLNKNGKYSHQYDKGGYL